MFPGLYASAEPSLEAKLPQPAQPPAIRLEDVVTLPPRPAEDPRMVEQAKRAVQQRIQEEERRKAVEAERKRRARELEELQQRVQAAVAASTPNPGTYVGGQCTWYVASRRSVPPYWGNAAQWLASARADGWQTGPTPVVGAIAWTAMGPYGHVAFVEAVQGSQVLIAEMNALYGPYNVDERWVPASDFFYIY